MHFVHASMLRNCLRSGLSSRIQSRIWLAMRRLRLQSCVSASLCLLFDFAARRTRSLARPLAYPPIHVEHKYAIVLLHPNKETIPLKMRYVHEVVMKGRWKTQIMQFIGDYHRRWHLNSGNHWLTRTRKSRRLISSGNLMPNHRCAHALAHGETEPSKYANRNCSDCGYCDSLGNWFQLMLQSCFSLESCFQPNAHYSYTW